MRRAFWFLLTLAGLVVLTLAGCHRRGSTRELPPQFAGLKTAADDLTCGAAAACPSWTMPPIPAPGASWEDPTYGTTIWRLEVPPAEATGESMSTYSRVQAWSSDNHWMFTSTYQGLAALYDATQTPPRPINVITPDVGMMLPVSLDVLWAFTDPNRIYYVPNRSSGHGLELRYVDVRGCTSEHCNLVSTLVHTFACTSDGQEGDIAAGLAGNQVETGSGAQGGMFDKTDRYFSFSCDLVDGGGRHAIDFIRYDRETNTVTYQAKWYKVCPGQTASGCGTWNTTGLRKNLFRMHQHPDSRFIEVVWQGGARDANWKRGLGAELYNPDYNYVGVVSPYNGHQDSGFDVHGTPVWVGIGAYRGNLDDERAISVTDLTQTRPDAQTYKRFLLPCSYARQPTCTGTSLTGKHSASHISMTATWAALQGYAEISTMMMAGPSFGTTPQYPPGTTLTNGVKEAGETTVELASVNEIAVGVVSTVDTGSNMESVTWTAVSGTTATATFKKSHAAGAMVRCLSCGNTGFAAMENFVVLIDASAADNSALQFWRIGRTMAIRDADYNAEPHTAVNRDFTQLVWGSTWNVDPGTNGKTYGFWTKLGESTPAPIPPEPTPCACVERTVAHWAWFIVLAILVVVWAPILIGAWIWRHRKS